MNMTWAEVFTRLKSYTKLQPNWDSYGAEPPTFETSEMAERWAGLLELCGAAVPDNVAPIGNGIEFEWNESHNIDFFNDGSVVVESYAGTAIAIVGRRSLPKE